MRLIYIAYSPPACRLGRCRIQIVPPRHGVESTVLFLLILFFSARLGLSGGGSVLKRQCQTAYIHDALGMYHPIQENKHSNGIIEFYFLQIIPVREFRSAEETPHGAEVFVMPYLTIHTPHLNFSHHSLIVNVHDKSICRNMKSCIISIHHSSTSSIVLRQHLLLFIILGTI